MTEDLSIFLDDFGVVCTFGAINVKVILEEPDTSLSLGFDGVRTSCPSMFFITGSLILTPGDVVEIEGQSFRVRNEPEKIDDGKFSEVGLIK